MSTNLNNDALVALCDCLTKIENKKVLFGNKKNNLYALYLEDENGISMLEPEDKDYTTIIHTLLMNKYLDYVVSSPAIQHNNSVFTVLEMTEKGKELKQSDFDKLKNIPDEQHQKEYVLCSSDNKTNFCIARALLSDNRHTVINNEGKDLSSSYINGYFETRFVNASNIVAHFSEDRIPEMTEKMNAMQEEIADITKNYDDEIKELKDKIKSLLKGKNRDKELVVKTMKEMSKENTEKTSLKM